MRTAELVEGSFAAPDGGPQPGVVVIPDVWGLSGHTRNIAGRLAREGFAALALDREDEITKGTLVTHAGAVVNEVVQKQLEA